MKLVIVAAGRLKEPWVREGCAEYEKRIGRHFPIDTVEVKDAAAVEAHVARMPARTHVVALDERGPQRTSEELAARFEAWMRGGAPQIALAIGDADGHTDGLRARADEQLGLSRLTLPHRLARLVLVEQLYRALSIVRGEPYHRG